MARKKRKETIVINPTELVPTTIGTIETKENGPILVIVIIVLLLIGIFFLDDITEFINNRGVIPSNPIVQRPNPEKPEEDSPTTTNEIHKITEDLSFDIEGFQFSNITIEENTLQLKVTRKEGKTDLFLNNNYYIELYNDKNTFLQRIKIDNVLVSNSRNFTFDITLANKEGTIGAISVVPKTTDDYPIVDLKEKNPNEYALVCKKESETMEYIFTKEKDLYSLIEMNEEITFEDSLENYDDLLDEYTDLVDSLDGIDGMDVTLTPLTTGFTYQMNSDLTVLDESDYDKYLKETKKYYPGKTEAKIIAFELETSGYTCE